MSKCILLCEDDQGILDISKLVLEDMGYKVVTCKNGNDVLEKIRKEKPAIILLDLWIAGINGEKVTQILKSKEDTKRIPIIIVSANNEAEKITKRIGADDLLLKPFDIKELENIVTKYTNTLNRKKLAVDF